MPSARPRVKAANAGFKPPRLPAYKDGDILIFSSRRYRRRTKAKPAAESHLFTALGVA